ncbi:unnamed protein product [Cuscuta epithymum]|uniref:Uncharacterized protein n=1 Tax=Cuscuta epithymum TaxID=186058 RepID=A0AAV0DNU2_9ASTE|nr:unnamed protein product [Cuscuta epithymum]
MDFSADLDFSIWDCKYTADEISCLRDSSPCVLYFDPQNDVINEKYNSQVRNILAANGQVEILGSEKHTLKLPIRSELTPTDAEWDAMVQKIMASNVNDDLGQEVSEERMHEGLRAHLKDPSPQSGEKAVDENMEPRVVSVVKTQGGMHNKTNGSLGEDSLPVRSNHKVSDYVRKTHIKIEPQEDDQFEANNNSILSSIKSRSGVLLEEEWPLFVKLEYINAELGSKSPPKRQMEWCKPRRGEKSAVIDFGNKKETHLALGNANKTLVSAPLQSKSMTSDLPLMKEGEILMVVTHSNAILKNDVQAPSPSFAPSESNREFKGMTRKDLRAIAKLHKVKGWYRLKRSDLEQNLHITLHAKNSGHI